MDDFTIARTVNTVEDEMKELFLSQDAFFKSGVTRPFQFRYGQLTTLYKAIERYEPQLMQAMAADLGKSEFEAFSTEIGQVYREISFIKKHLKSWMKPQRVSTPLIYKPSASYLQHVPRGVSLIIGPWNYPFLLVTKALVNSIAAGNTAILKPSEISVHTTEVLRKMIEEIFEPEYVAVITTDGPLVTDELIKKHPVNIIHFTGSERVGKIIMAAAAKQLTPVVLELGGKSPAVVAEDADIEFAAKKIIFSKWINAGQTCVAVDYLMVHDSVLDKLVTTIRKNLAEMYGSDASQSPDYGRIINAEQYERLTGYLRQGEILHGGKHKSEERYIEPTLLLNPSPDSPVMQEEVFGPILPVIPYSTQEEALACIRERPFPLAFYVYTQNRKTEKFFLENVRFGGGCVNNGLLHLGNNNLPFGGVMNSGMGNYHGLHGFRTFSHQQGIVKTPTWIDFPLYYPPVKDFYLKVIRRLLS